jgi:flagellar FliL protein
VQFRPDPGTAPALLNRLDGLARRIRGRPGEERMSGEAQTQPQESPKKAGKGKLLLLLGVIVVLLLGGGGGAYWFFIMRPAAAHAASAEGHGGALDEKAAKKHEGGAALKFDPFVVNLADEGGARYLRVGLSLVIDGDEAEAKELEETKVKLLRIRSAVLELLTQQTADHVVTQEGKKALREEIEKAAKEVLDPVEVTDVLFTEFVVQF